MLLLGESSTGSCCLMLRLHLTILQKKVMLEVEDACQVNIKVGYSFDVLDLRRPCGQETSKVIF